MSAPAIREEMTPAWRILLSAGGAGVAGDTLLRGGQWRLGFALWIATLVGCVVTLGGRPTVERRLLLLGLLMAGFGLAWRDADMLYAIDMLSVLCVGALLIWHGTGRRLHDLTLVETVRVGLLSALNTIAGGFGVVQDAMASGGDPSRRRVVVRALVLGAIIAVPPLAIVSRLLSASDAVFSGVLQRIGSTLFANGFTHVAVALLVAWLASGWLRAAVGESMGGTLPEVRTPGLTFVSLSVGLYSLLALLTLYIVTQARVLFGGAAFLAATEGLSVATYARDGFFQLIVAAGVVLGTLVLAEWLMAEDDVAGRRHFRIVGSVLIAMVAALLVSSAVRIWLYVSEFGLTVDRGFASAAIVWVAAALVTFALTTLRGRPAQFAPSTVLVTIGWVTLVNVINPEAMIVRVNVARAAQGQAFDAEYHATLSADALPVLRDQASRLAPAECAALAIALQDTWKKRTLSRSNEHEDWRSADWSLRGAEAWYASSASTPLCGSRATP